MTITKQTVAEKITTFAWTMPSLCTLVYPLVTDDPRKDGIDLFRERHRRTYFFRRRCCKMPRKVMLQGRLWLLIFASHAVRPPER